MKDTVTLSRKDYDELVEQSKLPHNHYITTRWEGQCAIMRSDEAVKAMVSECEYLKNRLHAYERRNRISLDSIRFRHWIKAIKMRRAKRKLNKLQGIVKYG